MITRLDTNSVTPDEAKSPDWTEVTRFGKWPVLSIFISLSKLLKVHEKVAAQQISRFLANPFQTNCTQIFLPNKMLDYSDYSSQNQ